MVDFKELKRRREEDPFFNDSLGEPVDTFEYRGLTDEEKYVRITPLEREEVTTAVPVREGDLSDDQTFAMVEVVERLRDGEHLVKLGGYAGTGKSTLIPLIASQWGSAKATAFCAPTGKAANVLARKLAAFGAEAAYVGTIHRLMYWPKQDAMGRITGWKRATVLQTSQGNDIKRIIVDEASMVGEELLLDLMSYGIPILLVGDHGQLYPVKDKFVLDKPDVRLERIHRQAEGNPILQLASAVRDTGSIPRDFPFSDRVQFFSRDKLYSTIRAAGARAGGSTGVLVRRNAERVRINNDCTKNCEVPIVGDLVICLRNSPPVFNGMRGRVKSIEPYREHWLMAQIEFADDGILAEGLLNKYQFGRSSTIGSVAELYDMGIAYPSRTPLTLLFDFGYAITVHKGQGSEFQEVVLRPERLPRDTDDDYARWLYTGITRASHRLSIVW